MAVSVARDYGPPSVEKPLGALPVVRDYLDRLGLVDTIDRLAPIRDKVNRATHGEVIAALVANRLTSPTPLLHVATWAREWAVEEVFGVAPDVLNDDRVGRALDALAPVCEAVVGSVGAAAIAAFGLDVSRVHWDMTSISLHGAYPEVDEDYATPKYGRPKDRRPDLKQVQTGLATTGDGGIPLVHRAYDGGAGEVSQVTGAMRALTQLAGPRRFLLVGDTKLVSYGNLTALTSTPGVTFLAPAPKAVVPADVLASQDWATATIIDHVAARDRDKPIHERAAYRAREGVTTLRGPRKKDPPVTVRTVFVWSSANAQAAQAARALKLARARDDLDTLARAAGSHHLYRTEAAVQARLTLLATKHRVSRYLVAATSVDPDTGKPALAWHFDQAALDAEATIDGWYALLTNLDPEIGPAEVLARYKGQEVSERRYGTFKGPLAVTPMFLHSNQRIHALIHVICLALLIFCLVERQARLGAGPDGKIPGLYAGRPARPTGALVFGTLSRLRLVPAQSDQVAYIPRPSALHQHLLDILGVDPTQPP
ncbi:IS1634 family transposase [Pseudofrankia sp. BMG5.37]|uniref:IS1634 family transposase n=1 Tax=Pseudofrankia sp. BMG5.37 TaxID=3050035 RepID=UPI002895F234|nr:IS1634 family transposase [Pseudofrankia sp. BMG5.37]MDT3443630.1 IS1634 family transposase [Pseudofrankia sp. BMG5.37]MDT3446049.1 IS1634 family transposase [Pseudofrankia sp. BMG5.37]MDT3446491.1 IS1634 family transposase [Pseudofrankia sp. BMG5.37]MDT3446537.1 IS1634 family transposase [Pseudofrankia sp. BMG5.37]